MDRLLDGRLLELDLGVFGVSKGDECLLISVQLVEIYDDSHRCIRLRFLA
jgi:hypothetical protein